jgi:hypothetical protein
LKNEFKKYNGGEQMLIVAAVMEILQRFGITNAPQWLLDALLAAGTLSLIISLVTQQYEIVLPLWAARAILTAEVTTA